MTTQLFSGLIMHIQQVESPNLSTSHPSLHRASDKTSIYVDPNSRVQVLDTVADLPTADKEQLTTFIVRAFFWSPHHVYRIASYRPCSAMNVYRSSGLPRSKRSSTLVTISRVVSWTDRAAVIAVVPSRRCWLRMIQVHVRTLLPSPEHARSNPGLFLLFGTVSKTRRT